MNNKKTKIKCRLVINGIGDINAKADKDLDIPDPDVAIGARVIKDAIQEDTEDDSQSVNS